MLEDWIERWRLGEQTAATAIYDHFRASVFRLAYGMLGNQGDAEDVMQETLKHALVNIGRYDPQRAQFKTWLHTIAVSRVRDKQRRGVTQRNLFNRLWQREQPRTNPSSERIVTQKQTHDSLLAAVQKLPQKQREVVVLRYWGGHTFPEIGRIVGKSEGTVKSRLRLAHQQLRRQVSGSALTED